MHVDVDLLRVYSALMCAVSHLVLFHFNAISRWKLFAEACSRGTQDGRRARNGTNSVAEKKRSNFYAEIGRYMLPHQAQICAYSMVVSESLDDINARFSLSCCPLTI